MFGFTHWQNVCLKLVWVESSIFLTKCSAKHNFLGIYEIFNILTVQTCTAKCDFSIIQISTSIITRFFSSYALGKYVRQQLLVTCKFYLTVHRFHDRVQSSTCIANGKYLQKSTMAVLTPILGIKRCSQPTLRIKSHVVSLTFSDFQWCSLVICLDWIVWLNQFHFFNFTLVFSFYLFSPLGWHVILNIEPIYLMKLNISERNFHLSLDKQKVHNIQIDIPLTLKDTYLSIEKENIQSNYRGLIFGSRTYWSQMFPLII